MLLPVESVQHIHLRRYQHRLRLQWDIWELRLHLQLDTWREETLILQDNGNSTAARWPVQLEHLQEPYLTSSCEKGIPEKNMKLTVASTEAQ
jgi:hypothetical protein